MSRPRRPTRLAARCPPPAATAPRSAARPATTATSSAATAAAARAPWSRVTPAWGRRPASARRPAATASSRAPKAATTAPPTNGDGCSSTCTVETGYHCSGAPSICTPLLEFDYYKTITSIERRSGRRRRPPTLSNYPDAVQRDRQQPQDASRHGGRVRSSNGYDIIFRGLDTTTCGGPTACTLLARD